jgi:hypothetical protein
MRSVSEVRRVRKQLEPFGFKYLAIEPRSKAHYPNVDPWEAFRLGANIAAQYDGWKHILVDWDSPRTPDFATAIIQTPKGYCIVLDGEGVERYYRPLNAYRLAQKGLLDNVDDEDFKIGKRIKERLERFGVKDDTAFHGMFLSADGVTYSLLPPSVSCVYQGRRGRRVREHSSQLPLCNQAPRRSNGRHVWRQRTWYNLTYDLMSVAEFFEIIGVNF